MSKGERKGLFRRTDAGVPFILPGVGEQLLPCQARYLHYFQKPLFRRCQPELPILRISAISIAPWPRPANRPNTSGLPLGEIVPVVLGILIPLQINTWNHTRQDLFGAYTVLFFLHGADCFNFKSKLRRCQFIANPDL